MKSGDDEGDSGRPSTSIEQELGFVMLNGFKNGIRIDSTVELKKFRMLFQKINQRELEITNQDLVTALSSTFIMHNNRVYHPELLVGDSQKEQIIRCVREILKTPGASVHYSVLFDKLRDVLLDTRISSQPLLRAYIEYELDGQYYMTERSICNGGKPDDLESDLLAYLNSQATSISFKQIKQSFPHSSDSDLKRALALCKDILLDNDNRFFSHDIIEITDVELKQMRAYIASYIESKRYVTPKEMYELLCSKFPKIHENYSDIGYMGWRSFFFYEFKDDFNFTPSTISKIGEQIDSKQVFTDFALNHNTYSMNDLASLADDLGTLVNYDVVFSYSTRISETKIISKDEVQFDIEKTDATLSYIRTGKYTLLSEIDDFSIFPNCGYPWNGFLLELYVDKYSQRYRLIHRGYNKTKYSGIIVDAESNLKFNDAVAEIIANSDIELTDAAILEFLVNHKIITTRRLGELESIRYDADNLRRRRGN